MDILLIKTFYLNVPTLCVNFEQSGFKHRIVIHPDSFAFFSFEGLFYGKMEGVRLSGH